MFDNLFFHHIKEIKHRFIYIIYSLILSISYCIYNWETLLYAFVKILNNSKELQKYIVLNDFIYTGVMDIFFNIIIFSLIISLIVNVPLIIFEILSFFISGCYLYEIKLYTKITLIGLIFFYVSLYIAYTEIFPSIYLFFLKMNNLNNTNLFNFNFEVHIDDIINFISKITLFSSFLSQLPIVIYVLNYLNILTSYTLFKYKKIMVFLTFIIINIIIPLDFINAFFIYLSVYFIYEISLFTITFLEINEIKLYEK